MAFEKVTWSKGDKVLLSKLQQMVANDDHLLESIVPVRFRAYGVTMTEGVKMLTGSVFFKGGEKKDQLQEKVSFPKAYFRADCEPIVLVTAVIHPGTDARVMTVVNGLDGRKPNNRGFVITMSHESSENKSFHFGYGTNVNWLAIGY